MSNFNGVWRILSPKTRKQLYTTLSTDAYDPRATDVSSMSAVTWYSQVMRGPGSRIQSYRQYDSMDGDIDISRSLDIIAEEMSGKDDKTELPFIIKWQKEDNQDVSDTTVVTVRAALRQWSQLQDLKKRVFSSARCMIKYGDCFFRKKSDTRKWEYIDPSLVVGIEIDELGNRVAYHVKKPGPQAQMGYGVSKNEFVDVVPAAAMVHLTMSDDMGDSAPFGQSVLRPVFRVFRQLSMLEDAVIIYRIVRAPERRVFYLDVGNMNQQQVKRYLEQVKNEIRQRRVPSAGGAGQKEATDGQYDPACFVLDTQIELLDGRTVTLATLIDEYNAGKKNWTYSCHPVTGKIMPGEIAWAGVTRRSAELVKITLDSGATIICTPDHKFPVQGVGSVRADQLDSSMSLVPFNRRWSSLDGKDIRGSAFHQGYEEIFDVSTKQWIKTHRLVAEQTDASAFTYTLEEGASVVHHVDFNKHNNHPSNLVKMGWDDHRKYHQDHNLERFNSWSEEKQAQQVRALNTGNSAYFDKFGDDRIKSDRLRASAISIANQAAGKTKTARRESSRPHGMGQRLRVSQKIVSLLSDKIKQDPTIRRLNLLNWMQTDAAFSAAFAEVNSPSASGRRSSASWTYLEVIKEHCNSSTFSELKSKLKFSNHKIVKVEALQERQDTGCITVGEGLHEYHTFALSAGIFTNNSLQEDYYFPVTASGRSSRVETLPGGAEDFGTNLLREFQSKIFRGLRIPTSYMGGADGSASASQTNDGKVGIAYIEELRFANFVLRLQDRMNEIYDEEFKIYLKVCGLRIDDEVFSIRLPDPANFALYRQAALDADLISSYNNIASDKTLAKRFVMKRYLGLSDDEIQMNEVMLKEERGLVDNKLVPIMQQMYDPAVYENREAVVVEPETSVPGMGGGEDEFDSDPTAGLLSSSGAEEPESTEEPESAPVEEPEAPTQPTP